MKNWDLAGKPFLYIKETERITLGHEVPVYKAISIHKYRDISTKLLEEILEIKVQKTLVFDDLTLYKKYVLIFSG